MSDQLARLHAVLDKAAAWTFAVSGGVDSMTLATLAHRHLPQHHVWYTRRRPRSRLPR